MEWDVISELAKKNADEWIEGKEGNPAAYSLYEKCLVVLLTQQIEIIARHNTFNSTFKKRMKDENRWK